ADYDLTVADEVSQQMKSYVRSTTTKVYKRFLGSCETSSPKRLTRTNWSIKGSDVIVDVGNNPFIVTKHIEKDEATNISANMMNVSNILNSPESNEVESHPTSTIPTAPPSHSYEVSSILNNSSNEVELHSTSKTSTTSPSPSSHNYKQPRFITNNEYMDMIWSPWHYGIVDLNDSRIMNVLEQPVKFYFEAEMKKYKPQKAVSKEALETLKCINVTSLSELGNALSSITINYENPNRDIVYLRHLFEKFGEVVSKAQKLLGIKSSKILKYDGVLSFNRKIEFIYVETATTSILSKRDKDLSKLREAIAIMFKVIASSLPEKLAYEISDLPILCIQFRGTTADVYLANWPVKMRPVVFSIMEFNVLEQATSLPSLTKSA
ncbi:7231_t:CDS:2, partial [Funneliformis mosseae]